MGADEAGADEPAGYLSELSFTLGLKGSTIGAAPKERRVRHRRLQSVVRWRGTRPMEWIVSSIRSGGILVRCACAREIDSFMSVPPRSFAPA